MLREVALDHSAEIVSVGADNVEDRANRRRAREGEGRGAQGGAQGEPDPGATAVVEGSAEASWLSLRVLIDCQMQRSRLGPITILLFSCN